MNIAIVDDEQLFIDIIQRNLQELKEYQIDSYSFLSVKDMEKSPISFDILLLDIDMPDYDGIVYAKEHKDKKVVFVTSQGNRMKEAFGKNVYGFIEKSDSNEDFCLKLREIIKDILCERTIDLKTDQGFYHFVINDIVYGQYLSNRNVSFIVDKQSYIYKGKTMHEFMEMLGESFYYIDRDTFINMNHVLGIVNGKIILRGVQEKLKVSSRRQAEIKNIFIRRKCS